MTDDADEKKHEDQLTDHEIEAIEEHTPIRPVAIFETIRRYGRRELYRPTGAILASGFLAGLALGLSVLAQAQFRTHLPDAEWRPLVESLGYSMGFLVVILGQMQLFTENTITAVCPVLDEPSPALVARLARMWSLVLGANLAGAAVFGAILWMTQGYQPEVWSALRDISAHALGYGWVETMLRGIGAGWLIAALVWMMPNAGDTRPAVIVVVTYFIALAGFTHVVAGTTEAALLVLAGGVSVWHGLGAFVLPATLGNLVGGTAVFTALAWAQIRSELRGEDEEIKRAFRSGEGPDLSKVARRAARGAR